MNEQINWKKELTTLIKAKTDLIINAAHFDYLLDRVSSWDYCPCGQLSNLIPRFSERESFEDTSEDCNIVENAPKDETLRNLGINFSDAFRNKNFEDANNLYDLIQLRAKFLMKEVTAKTKEKIAAMKKEIEELEKAIA